MQFYLIQVISELAAGQWFSPRTGFHISIFSHEADIVESGVRQYINVKDTLKKLTQQVIRISLYIRISHVYFRICIIVGNNRYTEDDIVKKLNIGRRAYLSSFMRVLFNHFDIQMKKRIPLCVIFLNIYLRRRTYERNI